MATYIDTHCHLNHPDYQMDLGEVLLGAEEAGVEEVLCVGFDMESSMQAVRLAREVKMIKAAVGVHPHDAGTFDEGAELQIRRIAEEREHIIAIGETGLDYYRDLSPRDAQQDAFRRHIRLAHELGLPLIVHSRDAQADVISIVEEEGLPSRGVVMHCLPSDPEFAKRAIDLGCHVGIAGPVTFANAEKLRGIVADLPIERILLETDAPYLTPHPYRGQRNEPSHLPLIAAAIARLHSLMTDEVAEQTTTNARRVFGW